MGIIVPPFYFNDCTDNMTGTPNGSGIQGVGCTAGTNNADGTAVTLLSALAHDVHFLVIAVGNYSFNAFAYRVLGDILVDPAGGTSWASFVDDLIVGGVVSGNTSAGQPVYYFMFPVFIKSGSSIGFQARSNHTTTGITGRINIWAYGNPSKPEQWWCGQKVESLGINASTSSGTDVTPGNSGSFGSWTNIGTSGGNYGAIQVGLGNSTSSVLSGDRAYHWQVGYDSVQLPGSPTWWGSSLTTEVLRRIGFQVPIWCAIPSGKTLQVRGTCSGTAEGTWDLAVYGVY